MQFTDIVVFAIVWGGLMSYFLIPIDDKIRMEGTRSRVFIVSLKKMFFHKKAILAFLLLIITLASIWFYFMSAEEYAKLHAITRESVVNPQEQAIFYMISTILYTALLFLFLAVRWTVISGKNR